MSAPDLPDLDYIKPDTKIALTGPNASPFCSCMGPATSSSSLHQDFEVEDSGITFNHIALEEGDVIVVDDFLTRDECRQLCAEIDANPALSFWSAAGRENDKARAFRDADTIEVNSKEIAVNMWNRIKTHMEHKDKIISIDEEGDTSNDSLWERELPGEWKPVNFNHDLLFVKYPSGGAFSPHTDGKAIHHFNRRSFYSVIVFLNDVVEGGGTRFYKKEALQHLSEEDSAATDAAARWTAAEELMTYEVQPAAGRLLFFDQRLVHEGVPPCAPCEKYIIRSDIMYQRVDPVCDSEKDREAYRLYREAEVLAEDGQVAPSISLFKRAIKMSPELAKYMGQ